MSNDAITRARAMMLADFDALSVTSRETSARIFDYVVQKCESPIEVLMLGALAFGLERFSNARQGQYPSFTARATCIEGVSLEVQKQIGPYRADFAITFTGESCPGAFATARAVIECDGHDFHNRTKEQAQRDRERDRYLQQCGWAVLRFTGSEIFRDPAACADQIADYLSSEVERLIDIKLSQEEAAD